MSAPDYKVLWERDSTALGKCLGEISTLRAVKEDQRAQIAVLTEELSAANEKLAKARPSEEALRVADEAKENADYMSRSAILARELLRIAEETK